MRKEFEMSKEQLERMIEACKPVPYMVFGGMPPRSMRENVDDAWAALGEEMGFEPMTVRPIPGKGVEHFTAEVADV